MAAKRARRPSAAAPPGLRLRTLAAGFVLAAVLAYLPALGAQYIWDDEAYVTGNETLRTMGGILRIWFDRWATPQYYPVVHTSFWLEYRLWGLWAAGYHAVNVLIHAANGVLFYLLLRRLTVPGALLAAALFTLHPVHVESVAWITERKNVLSGFFYLAAMLACLRFRPLGGAPVPPLSSVRREYLVALALFAAALLSKSVTSSLPAAFLVLVWWKEGRLTPRDVRLFVPFFVLGAVAGANTAWLEKTRVGAYGAEWALSAADRVLIAGRAVWFYLSKLVWPHPLIFIYPRWTIDARSLAQWSFPIAAIVVLALLFVFRRRLGRGPLAAALFFGGTLVPALGFFDVYPMRYSFVADHFQYLASLGPLTLLAALGVRLVSSRPDAARVARGAAALWLVVLGLITFQQTTHYRDYETLWRATLARNPACWMCHNNLGLLYEKTGRLGDAIAHYRQALEGNADGAAHTNLGNALLLSGRRDEALKHLREAVRISPDSAEAWNNLGGGLTEMGDGAEALRCYRRAAELDPDDGRLRFNLGTALLARGELDAARAELEEASQRAKPSFAAALGAAHFNLGNAFFQSNRVPDAEAQYRLALEARPEDLDARINLGYALLRQGRAAEAGALFREVLSRDPSSKRAQAGVALLGTVGRNSQ